MDTNNLSTINQDNNNALTVSAEEIENIEVKVIKGDDPNLIADNEKAVTDETALASYNEARSLGCFEQHYGMSNLTGALNNALYADKQVDASGEVFIRYTQKYRNGEYLPVIQLKQSNLLTAAAFMVCFPIQKRRIRIPVEKGPKRVSHLKPLGAFLKK